MALIEANILPGGNKGNAELKKHNSAISKDLDIESIQTFIDKAINHHLVPAIGQAQFDAIVAAKPDLQPNSKEATLLFALQRTATNFALGYYADFGAVQISDAGISVAKSETRLPASDKKIMALKRQSFAEAYASLELVTLFLEAHLPDFPLYAASEEHRNNRSRFINSSRDFPQKIRVDAELFETIKSIISQVEDNYILNVLGDDVNEALRERMLNDTLTALDNSLLILIRKAVGSLAIAEAIPYRLVGFDGTGAYVRSETVGGISGNVENKNPADMQRLQVTMNKLAQDGEADLERLRLWLNKHIAEYTGYTTSTMASLTKVNDNPDSSVYFL